MRSPPFSHTHNINMCALGHFCILFYHQPKTIQMAIYNF